MLCHGMNLWCAEISHKEPWITGETGTMGTSGSEMVDGRGEAFGGQFLGDTLAELGTEQKNVIKMAMPQWMRAKQKKSGGEHVQTCNSEATTTVSRDWCSQWWSAAGYRVPNAERCDQNSDDDRYGWCSREHFQCPP
ncbi:hypothetical protein C8J57DRAFT_1249472 [Mycena rebaudengoi]|nr:hypothetical protein C8J57DRAFT_1249472 [Mycena rebaudengoi]